MNNSPQLYAQSGNGDHINAAALEMALVLECHGLSISDAAVALERVFGIIYRTRCKIENA